MAKTLEQDVTMASAIKAQLQAIKASIDYGAKNGVDGVITGVTRW